MSIASCAMCAGTDRRKGDKPEGNGCYRYGYAAYPEGCASADRGYQP